MHSLPCPTFAAIATLAAFAALASLAFAPGRAAPLPPLPPRARATRRHRPARQHGPHRQHGATHRHRHGQGTHRGSRRRARRAPRPIHARSPEHKARTLHHALQRPSVRRTLCIMFTGVAAIALFAACFEAHLGQSNCGDPGHSVALAVAPAPTPAHAPGPTHTAHPGTTMPAPPPLDLVLALLAALARAVWHPCCARGPARLRRLAGGRHLPLLYAVCSFFRQLRSAFGPLESHFCSLPVLVLCEWARIWARFVIILFPARLVAGRARQWVGNLPPLWLVCFCLLHTPLSPGLRILGRAAFHTAMSRREAIALATAVWVSCALAGGVVCLVCACLRCALLAAPRPQRLGQLALLAVCACAVLFFALARAGVLVALVVARAGGRSVVFAVRAGGLCALACRRRAVRLAPRLLRAAVRVPLRVCIRTLLPGPLGDRSAPAAPRLWQLIRALRVPTNNPLAPTRVRANRSRHLGPWPASKYSLALIALCIATLPLVTPMPTHTDALHSGGAAHAATLGAVAAAAPLAAAVAADLSHASAVPPPLAHAASMVAPVTPLAGLAGDLSDEDLGLWPWGDSVLDGALDSDDEMAMLLAGGVRPAHPPAPRTSACTVCRLPRALHNCTPGVNQHCAPTCRAPDNARTQSVVGQQPGAAPAGTPAAAAGDPSAPREADGPQPAPDDMGRGDSHGGAGGRGRGRGRAHRGRGRARGPAPETAHPLRFAHLRPCVPPSPSQAAKLVRQGLPLDVGGEYPATATHADTVYGLRCGSTTIHMDPNRFARIQCAKCGRDTVFTLFVVCAACLVSHDATLPCQRCGIILRAPSVPQASTSGPGTIDSVASAYVASLAPYPPAGLPQSLEPEGRQGGNTGFVRGFKPAAGWRLDGSKHYVIYTDGSCVPAPGTGHGPAGIGFVIEEHHSRPCPSDWAASHERDVIQVREFLSPDAASDIAEFLAILRGLEVYATFLPRAQPTADTRQLHTPILRFDKISQLNHFQSLHRRAKTSAHLAPIRDWVYAQIRRSGVVPFVTDDSHVRGHANATHANVQGIVNLTADKLAGGVVESYIKADRDNNDARKTQCQNHRAATVWRDILATKLQWFDVTDSRKVRKSKYAHHRERLRHHLTPTSEPEPAPERVPDVTASWPWSWAEELAASTLGGALHADLRHTPPPGVFVPGLDKWQGCFTGTVSTIHPITLPLVAQAYNTLCVYASSDVSPTRRKAALFMIVLYPRLVMRRVAPPTSHKTLATMFLAGQWATLLSQYNLNVVSFAVANPGQHGYVDMDTPVLVPLPLPRAPRVGDAASGTPRVPAFDSAISMVKRGRVSSARKLLSGGDRLLPLGLQTEELLSEWQKIAFFFD